MVRQARAEATRRRIIEAGVELFDELGYGETGLADVLQRAGVSKGAFYYHFDSKEAVAAAIIDDFDRMVTAAAAELFDPASPKLEEIIRATFKSADIIRSDKTASVGHQLLQSLGQISSAAARVYKRWTHDYLEVLTRAISGWELRKGLEIADAVEGIWVGIAGSHLLSAAMGDDPFERLTKSWRMLLRVLAPEDQVDALVESLELISADYRAAV